MFKRGLRQDGDAFPGDLGQIGFRGSQAKSGYHSLPGRGPGDLGPKWPNEGHRWGPMPPLPRAKALKRDDNVGLDLELQLGGQARGGKVGQPTKLANFTASARRGTWYLPRGRFPCASWGLGPSEWRPTLRQPSLSPTFPPTHSVSPRAVGTCENRDVTPTIYTHSHQPSQ